MRVRVEIMLNVTFEPGTQPSQRELEDAVCATLYGRGRRMDARAFLSGQLERALEEDVEESDEPTYPYVETVELTSCKPIRRKGRRKR